MNPKERLGRPVARANSKSVEKVGKEPTGRSVGETQYSSLPARDR